MAWGPLAWGSKERKEQAKHLRANERRAALAEAEAEIDPSEPTGWWEWTVSFGACTQDDAEAIFARLEDVICGGDHIDDRCPSGLDWCCTGGRVDE